MSDLFNKLSAYGVNFSEVMERFVDDEELYADCLVAFMSDSSFDGLKKVLDTKNYDAAFEHAHTLKGVAGNLGLTPLYHTICEIVEPLRIHDYANLSHLYSQILDEKSKLQQIL